METKNYPKSVSRKFYDSLMLRVEEIIKEAFHSPGPEYLRQAQRIINSYLDNNLSPIPEKGIYWEVRLIFISLKAEIDRARRRSKIAKQAARLRVAKRRAAVRAAKEQSDSQTSSDNNNDGSEVAARPPVGSSNPASSEVVRRKRTGLKWSPATNPPVNRRGKRSHSGR